MKKIFAFVLAAAMVLSMVGCGAEKESLKLGMGVHANITGADADADTDGNAEVVATVAAVLVDKDGKIVKCEIDTLDATVAFTSEGKAVAADGFRYLYGKYYPALRGGPGDLCGAHLLHSYADGYRR